MADATGRRGEFDDGSHGGDIIGTGTHLATSIQQNISPMFSPGSVLHLPNMIRPINGMSVNTYNKALPMQSMLRSTTMMSDGNGVMNV